MGLVAPVPDSSPHARNSGMQRFTNVTLRKHTHMGTDAGESKGEQRRRGGGEAGTAEERPRNGARTGIKCRSR